MNKIKLFNSILIGLTLIVSCSKSGTSNKELELKEKELELKNKELDIEKLKLTKIVSVKDSASSKNNLKEEVVLNQEFHNGQAGFIKNIFVKNGLTHLVVDFIQLKPKGEMNDFYVVNDNKKLRTYVVNSSSVIYNCLTNTKMTYKNLNNYKNTIVNQKDIFCLFDTENGMVTVLNIMCFN